MRYCVCLHIACILQEFWSSLGKHYAATGMHHACCSAFWHAVLFPYSFIWIFWHALVWTCCLSFWNIVCMYCACIGYSCLGVLHACRRHAKCTLVLACIFHVYCIFLPHLVRALRVQKACQMGAVLFCTFCVHFGTYLCLVVHALVRDMLPFFEGCCMHVFCCIGNAFLGMLHACTRHAKCVIVVACIVNVSCKTSAAF